MSFHRVPKAFVRDQVRIQDFEQGKFLGADRKAPRKGRYRSHRTLDTNDYRFLLCNSFAWYEHSQRGVTLLSRNSGDGLIATFRVCCGAISDQYPKMNRSCQSLRMGICNAYQGVRYTVEGSVSQNPLINLDGMCDMANSQLLFLRLRLRLHLHLHLHLLDVYAQVADLCCVCN